MNVILLEDTRHLGKRGETVKVKPGFARNFLLPKGIALEATPGNVAYFAHQRRKIDAVHTKQIEEARTIADQIAEVDITIAKRVGEKQTLYGSVTTAEIAKKLKAKGFVIDKRRVELEGGVTGLKSLGDHTVKIDLHPEVIADLTVSVVAEE